MTYAIDLKVYEAARTYEVPFILPMHVVSDSCLRPGYHSLSVSWPEETVESFCAWAASHGSILKVIGTTKCEGL